MDHQSEQWKEVLHLLFFKWRWIILIAAIFGPLSCWLYEISKEDQFKSSISVLVLPRMEDGKVISSALGLDTYAELAKSEIVISKLRKTLAGKITIPHDLQYECLIKTTQYGKGIHGVSPIMTLRVQSKNSDYLGEIVRTWSKKFLDYIGELHFSIETDLSAYMEKQADNFMVKADSLAVVSQDMDKGFKLNVKLEELSILKKHLMFNISKVNELKYRIRIDSITLRNDSDILDYLSKASTPGHDNFDIAFLTSTNLEDKQKSENRISILEAQIAQKSAKLKQSEVSLANFLYQEKVLNNAVQVIETTMTKIPKLEIQTKVMEEIKSPHQPVRIKTENPNPFFQEYYKEKSKTEKRLLALKRSKELDLQISQAYQTTIDSLFKILNEKRKKMALMENSLLVQAERNRWRVLYVDSLVKKTDRLKANILTNRSLKRKLDRNLAELESQYYEKSHYFSMLDLKHNRLRKDTDRYNKYSESFLARLSKYQLENSMGMANLRMLTSEADVLLVAKKSAGLLIAATFIAVLMMSFFTAFLVVTFKPDYERAVAKEKVLTTIEKVEKQDLG